MFPSIKQAVAAEPGDGLMLNRIKDNSDMFTE